CKICKNIKDNKTYQVREMMFGFNDIFDYIECAKCGCLQIDTIPDNLQKYYPGNYYSFNDKQRDNFVISFLKKCHKKYHLTNKSVIGFIFSKFFKEPYYYRWLKPTNVNFNSKILDIGCGMGKLLLELHLDGFNNLKGIDPFINKDIIYKNGVSILKKEIHEMKEPFDLIMLNHSFEHMPEPLLVLKLINNLLEKNGCCLIRIPIASSYAWKKYNVNWVQLDAPRHFFLHTVESIKILCELSNFYIKDIIYDSTDFQFWGSEQYLRNISIKSKDSYNGKNTRNSIFTKEQIKKYKQMTEELNANKQGDSACFYLYKS
ncbi:MAG: hypothetical protein ACD_79C01490G0003, partial [uncultured bacterium]